MRAFKTSQISLLERLHLSAQTFKVLRLGFCPLVDWAFISPLLIFFSFYIHHTQRSFIIKHDITTFLPFWPHNCEIVHQTAVAAEAAAPQRKAETAFIPYTSQCVYLPHLNKIYNSNINITFYDYLMACTSMHKFVRRKIHKIKNNHKKMRKPGV